VTVRASARSVRLARCVRAARAAPPRRSHGSSGTPRRRDRSRPARSAHDARRIFGTRRKVPCSRRHRDQLGRASPFVTRSS
jgi:hypothetical protein